MTISRDRVKFTLTETVLCRNGMDDVLNKAFNINIRTAMSYLCYEKDYASKALTIICRPSQFARFLIYRNDACINNVFKAMNPELFIPEEEKKTPLDVSTNESRRGHETSHRRSC